MTRTVRISLVLLLILTSACSVVRGIPLPSGFPTGLPGFFSAPATPTPLGHTSLPPTHTPLAAGGTPGGKPGTTVPAPTSTAIPALTIWVPPDFSPIDNTPAGQLLNKRLEDFSRQYGGVEVQVRVKAVSGPGGLLEALAAAGAAAPLALPSLIALPRADLETAALKGLIFPLDGTSNAIDQADWYNYARQLAMVQGATFALPFAGDALILPYRPAKVPVPPTDWPAVFRMAQPLGFPAGDPQALLALSLYQASGGAVEDSQRRPTLQPELLSQVLQVFTDGEQRGVFPYWLSQYETSGQVWQAYRDGRVNALITWSSNYLSSLPPDTTAVPVPRMNGSSLSLATGWGWAVADPVPERRSLSIKLAEYLTEGQFLAAWSEAAGYLPTRPSALAAWNNQSLKTLLSPVAVSAQARPTIDQLSSLGPVLKEATLKVLKRESDPTQAAKAASEKLSAPEAK